MDVLFKEERKMARSSRSLGLLLLGIYLVLVGLAAFGLRLPYGSVIHGLLALIAGILILIGR